MTTTTTPTPRTLAEPQKVQLKKDSGERLLRPKRGGSQRHFVAPGEDVTLCGLDTTRWMDTLDESAEKTVTCPHCAARLSKGQRVSDRKLAADKKEAKDAKAAPDPAADAAVDAMTKVAATKAAGPKKDKAKRGPKENTPAPTAPAAPEKEGVTPDPKTK